MNQITKQTTCDRLLDILPHGSGINGNWSIEYNQNTHAFYASNYFEAMNEWGAYCHTYDFTAKYHYNGKDKTVPCEYCHGLGNRSIQELADIRHEDIDTTRAFLADKFPESQPWQESFICNVCCGKGNNPVKEFELLNINFRGEREHTCCGYGLRDYLYETLTLS